MTILYAGIDLAKNIFALHGVAAGGAVVLRQPRVARAKLHELVAGLPPCTIGTEACSGAHHWGRLFAADGARRQAGDEFVQLGARNPGLAQHDRTVGGDSVQGKDVLGEIDSNVQNT